MTHQFPTLNWTPCDEPPDNCRRVVVWHRRRPYCRHHEILVGWWNTNAWRWDFPWFINPTGWDHGLIYQPKFWRDIELPTL